MLEDKLNSKGLIDWKLQQDRSTKQFQFQFYLTNSTQFTQETQKYSHIRMIALQEI